MKNDYFPTQFYGVGPKKGKKVSLLPPQFGQSESVHIKQSRIRINCVVTRVTRRVPLVEQELLALPDNMSSLPAVSCVRVTRSLVLCVMFWRSWFVLLAIVLSVLLLAIVLSVLLLAIVLSVLLLAIVLSVLLLTIVLSVLLLAIVLSVLLLAIVLSVLLLAIVLSVLLLAIVLSVLLLTIVLSVLLLTIVLSVLRSTDSDYPFGIFKIFFSEDKLLVCVYTLPDEQNKSKRSTHIHTN